MPSGREATGGSETVGRQTYTLLIRHIRHYLPTEMLARSLRVVERDYGKNAGRMPALPKNLESCGVDGGDAGFGDDAFDFHGFGEDGALQAVGENFHDVAYFGRARWVAQNVHGLRADLIYADANGHPLGLFVGGVFVRGVLGDGAFCSGVFC